MSKELYVGNLPFAYGEEELRRLFSVAGTVTYIHLITDPVSGQSKGCGYVKMSSEREAKEAINCLDEALVEDRRITVSIARPPKPKAGPAAPRAPRPAGQGPFKPRGGKGPKRR